GGFRRRPLDGDDRGRTGGARDRAVGGALCAVPLARGGELLGPRALCDAQRVRRACGAEEGPHVMDVAAPARVRAAEPSPRQADPCAFVIFGAAGDLTKRLLVPALYNLAVSRLLPDGFAVFGIARGEMSDDA